MRPLWLAALALAACGRSGVAHEAPDAGGLAVVRADAGPGEPASDATCSEEIHFTQALGCQNDGAVELCALADDATAELLARVAPGLYRIGTPGRLGCVAPQTAYLLPLDPSGDWCVALHGAMTDRGWAVLCALAARPEVTAIAPWWAE
ncbi:MAG: hypothetical protein AB1730_15410 [Myxococcota bacterium]